MKFQKIMYMWTSLSKLSLINLMYGKYSLIILLFDKILDISIFVLLKVHLHYNFLTIFLIIGKHGFM